jgi:hypothetical protein
MLRRFTPGSAPHRHSGVKIGHEPVERVNRFAAGEPLKGNSHVP